MVDPPALYGQARLTEISGDRSGECRMVTPETSLAPHRIFGVGALGISAGGASHRQRFHVMMRRAAETQRRRSLPDLEITNHTSDILKA